jgi:hypothetical protein
MMFLPVLLPADKDCGVLPSGMAVGAQLEFPEGPQSAPGEQPQEKLLELVKPPKSVLRMLPRRMPCLIKKDFLRGD